jgi:GntR family transcriptional regulator / MocR family aminotransferase
MDLQLQLDEASTMPLYWQIYWQIRQQILHGQAPAGARLPPSRWLAQHAGVARVTVTQAYRQLEAEGYVSGRAGAGTFVTPLPLPPTAATATPFAPVFSAWGQRVLSRSVAPPATVPRPEIDFGFGRSFPHTFPYDIWRRLLARYLSTDDVMLSRYGSVAGFYPLRQAIADYLARLRGVRCTAAQVVIVSGAQQALDILARLLLAPGDEVVVETPGYDDAFALFRAHGARLTALPVDDEGLPVEFIPPASRPRLVFVTPSNQFPKGGAMPLRRRLALLQWARRVNAVVVEDDYDGELRYDGRPLTALQGLDEEGRVVYLGSFSKVLFPALRLAYVALPPALAAAFTQAKGLVDRGAPTLTQAAVADFITEGHFERHLRHLRHDYGRRRQALAQALDRYLPEVRYSAAAAGLHVMLYLDESADETAVAQRAAEQGVGVYPGAPYHQEKPAPPSILLGFSGLSEGEIEEGVRRLSRVIKNG